MLKERFEKTKEFVKDHKKEIVICTGIVVGGIVIWKIAKRSPVKKVDGLADELVNKLIDVKDFKIELPRYIKEDIPEGLASIVTEISHPETVTDWTDVWFGDTKLSELGDFGQKLAEIKGFDINSNISGIVSLTKVANEL